MSLDPVALAHDGVGYEAAAMAHDGLLEIEFAPPTPIGGGGFRLSIPPALQTQISAERIDEDDVLLIVCALYSKRLQ